MSIVETWTNPRDDSLMRVITAGPFVMGSTQEDIASAVRMHKDGGSFALLHESPQFEAWTPGFSIGVFAVSNAQFARFLSAIRPSAGQLASWVQRLERIAVPAGTRRRYEATAGFEQHPAVNISWYGAAAYCNWAGLRLPTEIEWERAARGTDDRVFPWGNDWRPDALRWYEGRSPDETTAPVDAFVEGSSPDGIVQMAGNVEEWCSDRYQSSVYARYALADLSPPRQGHGRVVRGGTCLMRTPIEFRCAMRRMNSPALVNILHTGIRCACDGPGKPTPSSSP